MASNQLRAILLSTSLVVAASGHAGAADVFTLTSATFKDGDMLAKRGRRHRCARVELQR